MSTTNGEGTMSITLTELAPPGMENVTVYVKISPVFTEDKLVLFCKEYPFWLTVGVTVPGGCAVTAPPKQMLTKSKNLTNNDENFFITVFFLGLKNEKFRIPK